MYGIVLNIMMKLNPFVEVEDILAELKKATADLNFALEEVEKENTK